MKLMNYIEHLEKKIELIKDIVSTGKVIRISGVLVESIGLQLPIGGICKINTPHSSEGILAEVIGFHNNITYLIAFEEPTGVLPGTRIQLIHSVFSIPAGSQLIGRIINGFGKPIDNLEPLNTLHHYPIMSTAINPIERNRITEPLDVGIRAINGLLTVGLGQRLGIFAGSGVGKSMLLGMITKFTQADIVVVGLIGERGREVKEFIEEIIGKAHLKKTVIIAAPIDTSPLERANGVLTAVTIAEYFRDEGKQVLLIIDSLTRYAQALRQMYLLLGEPPSAKGYSPSVFAKLSQVAERCGNGIKTQGSITAFFTVLAEGDDMNDPVADHVRSILDGHIVLSRALAEMSHYPAIDINASISRVMPLVVDKTHQAHAMRFKRLYAHYLQNQDLIKMGMYKFGTDPLLDEAMKIVDTLNNFLRQELQKGEDFSESVQQLAAIFQ